MSLFQKSDINKYLKNLDDEKVGKAYENFNEHELKFNIEDKLIYPHDHNPPHFHVKSNDQNRDAFTILQFTIIIIYSNY